MKYILQIKKNKKTFSFKLFLNGFNSTGFASEY